MADFLVRKALNSNHLGNSLDINIVKTSGSQPNSQFRDLHIWRFLTF